MLIDQAEHTPAPLKGTRLPIIFFIIKQLCKFFVKFIYKMILLSCQIGNRKYSFLNFPVPQNFYHV